MPELKPQAETDVDDGGKLFVGGLSWESTQENLQRYFSRYGEVIDCVVMKNTESGRSRGFGFVTFSDPANVDLVLENGPHHLDGRTIDPKPCNPRSMQKPKRQNNSPKIFLGGLPSNVTETDLRNFFTSYGKVIEVVIMYDQERKKSRGFGFLSFENADSVERVVSEHYININGKQIEIKRAEPRDTVSKMGGGGGHDMGVANHWGPPSGGPPMGMGGGMGPMGPAGGQMGGPMGHPGGMMQGYQGWGAPQQQGYAPQGNGHWGPSPPNNQPQGYGPPQGPQGYQSWGGPAGPQTPQMTPQWGGPTAGYGGPPQQPGYGSGPSAGPPSVPVPCGPKPSGDYGGYPNQYGGYQQNSGGYGPGRGYGQTGGNQQGYGHPLGGGPPDYNYTGNTPNFGGVTADAGATTYAGGPGPQRGGSYSQPQSQTGFHPYRRM